MHAWTSDERRSVSEDKWMNDKTDNSGGKKKEMDRTSDEK